MAAILDLRSCELWVHFKVHMWIEYAQKHGFRHQDQLHGIDNTKIMLVFNFGYFGCRPSWKWLQKVPSRFVPPGILVDRITRTSLGLQNWRFQNYSKFFPVLPLKGLVLCAYWVTVISSLVRQPLQQPQLCHQRPHFQIIYLLTWFGCSTLMWMMTVQQTL